MLSVSVQKVLNTAKCWVWGQNYQQISSFNANKVALFETRNYNPDVPALIAYYWTCLHWSWIMTMRFWSSDWESDRIFDMLRSKPSSLLYLINQKRLQCKFGNSKLNLLTELQLHQSLQMSECASVQTMPSLKHTRK